MRGMLILKLVTEQLALEITQYKSVDDKMFIGIDGDARIIIPINEIKHMSWKMLIMLLTTNITLHSIENVLSFSNSNHSDREMYT